MVEFGKLKVGDRLWSALHGWGTVERLITNDNTLTYPLEMRFDIGKGSYTYTTEGRRNCRDLHAELYLEEMIKLDSVLPKSRIAD